MDTDVGRVLPDQALVQAPSPTVSALAGFDPSRAPGLFPFNGFAPGGYMGTCSSCQQTVYDIAKRASTCLPCAMAELKASHEGLSRALRIRLWNESKGFGKSDRAAMQYIEDTLAAIAIDARQRQDGEARLDPKG